MNGEIIGNLFSEKMKLIKEGKCPFCTKPVDLNSFKDDLSKKEYRISGMCQGCQDDFFV